MLRICNKYKKYATNINGSSPARRASFSNNSECDQQFIATKIRIKHFNQSNCLQPTDSVCIPDVETTEGFLQRRVKV